ncbi:MAG TPA: peptidoglycan DD-metalloendopeptidase family protein [Candidatus Saccharimonadales bacterium]|nr:peptidoglycan DD-metalloendopeptidase family protein [Candidatus Saccharimonadales bacterium]
MLNLIFAALIIISVAPLNAHAEATRNIVFPVLGPASYSNDFYAPRDGGIHGATDILASKMQALVAAVDGTVTRVNYPQPSWGYAIYIRDSEGYSYNYLHINNDTPGTNDNAGNPMYAYAADMKVGNPVVKGQLLGYVGDSGNSNGVSHLHFEIVAPDGTLLNPFYSLQQAQIYQYPVNYPALPNEILPYGQLFTGNVNIAMADFNGVSPPEIITGAGRGGGPHVRIFNSDHTYHAAGFLAYNPDMFSGVDVAAGDLNGDGINEIITAPGPGAGPDIKVFKLDGTLMSEFFAYDDGFRGGVHVAAGDVDGDGIDEIITGAGPGGGPHVKAFKLNGTVVSSFFAYEESFRGGVDVASADVTGSSADEIMTGAGPGGGPLVKVFDQSGSLLHQFYAYSGDYAGGVRISAGNVRTSTAKAEILTAPESYGGPEIKMFNATGQNLSTKMFLEQWWQGFYDIAAGTGSSMASTGVNRRASVRPAF